MPHQWETSQLGVTELDDSHREFVVQVKALIAAGDAQFPVLFAALIAHTRDHFMAEGRMMRDARYPGLSIHESEHHRVLGELQQLNRTLKRGHLPLVRAFVKQGLPEWFNTHLTMMDAALVSHLQKQAAAILSEKT